MLAHSSEQHSPSLWGTTHRGHACSQLAFFPPLCLLYYIQKGVHQIPLEISFSHTH